MSIRPSWSYSLALAFALGCGSSSSTEPSSTPAPTPAPAGGEAMTHGSALTNAPGDAAVAMPETPTAPPPPAPVEPVSISAGARRDVPSPTPRVQIRFPANNATVRENHVEVRLGVEHWRTTTDAADHRHIHLILDNNPYIRVDDPEHCGEPCNLQNLAEGTHVLRAFPGWDTHESVKTDGAFTVVVFTVGHPTPDWHFNPRAPLLTYSRPKGEYNGPAADHILLDWYLSNIPAADINDHGFRVRATIDGTAQPEMTSWVPHDIDHLPDGHHTIVLDLLGHDGTVVPGPFNHTEREITVNHAAPATDPHAAPAGGEHAGH